ncbi:dTDP-glucose 4,6-dehydratase [Actinoallomurus sp. CA-150999]|uniref:dTDP-glucose 4,6-dehydratase n=1 Tax=Actinoallomurus sp. CA-150999 TaxID=3239887 RepID=UPI003D8AA89C
MPRTIVVTGAAGFIGGNLVRHWRAAEPADTIVAIDALTYAGDLRNLAGLDGDIEFAHADIGDEERMLALLGGREIDVVVNLAAESHNSLAVVEPERFFRTNVLGTQVLLDVCRRVGVGRFHHVSTCEVYGDLPLDAAEGFLETSPYRPNTPYSASKAGADHLVRAYHSTYGMPVTISNCANNHGPYQFPEKVLPLFVTNALAGRPLPMYASTRHRREWISVADHCAAITAIVERGAEGATYHVGTGEEASIEELADLVLDELGLPASLKTVVPDRPGHDRRYLLDARKIRRELGWRPTVSFETGIRETIRWYRDHRSWWEPLLSRRLVTEDAWPARPVASSPAGRSST